MWPFSKSSNGYSKKWVKNLSKSINDKNLYPLNKKTRETIHHHIYEALWQNYYTQHFSNPSEKSAKNNALMFSFFINDKYPENTNIIIGILEKYYNLPPSKEKKEDNIHPLNSKLSATKTKRIEYTDRLRRVYDPKIVSLNTAGYVYNSSIKIYGYVVQGTKKIQIRISCSDKSKIKFNTIVLENIIHIDSLFQGKIIIFIDQDADLIIFDANSLEHLMISKDLELEAHLPKNISTSDIIFMEERPVLSILTNNPEIPIYLTGANE
jgi:hypothetical protein